MPNADDECRSIEQGNIRERHFSVDMNFEGWRLDRFLSNRLQRLSRSKAAQIIRYGDIEIVPRRRLKPSTKLQRGDVVILRQHLEEEELQDDEVELLYKDEALVVLNKPAGMLVHESANVRLNTIQWWLRRHGFEGAEPVHRLDRETSGVLICAAASEWVAPLRAVFATDHPDKIYRALVWDSQGQWTPGLRKTLDIPLGLDPNSDLGLKMGPGDLRAVTHVEALRPIEHSTGPVNGFMSDLKVIIETGRQHQIRVHLALCGTPIAGDKLYSLSDDFFRAISDSPHDPDLLARLPFPRHALHAWKLAIEHPITGRFDVFEAPLPEIWPPAQMNLVSDLES